MSDIERRIETLERANRHWRSAALLLAALLLIVLVGAASSPEGIPDVLKAKRIELIGPNGKPVIVMGAQGKGSAFSMVGYGSEHRRAIGMSVDEDGARMMLMKHAEAPLLRVQVDDLGSSIMMFDGREPSQQPRSIVLRSAQPSEGMVGGTGITLMKGPYKSGVEASLSMDESAQGTSLMLGGSEGKAARMLVSQKNGKVGFLTPDGEVIWATP